MAPDVNRQRLEATSAVRFALDLPPPTPHAQPPAATAVLHFLRDHYTADEDKAHFLKILGAVIRNQHQHLPQLKALSAILPRSSKARRARRRHRPRGAEDGGGACADPRAAVGLG